MSEQKPAAWLHCDRPESDVITDKVKNVWDGVTVGYLASYSIPLYTALPDYAALQAENAKVSKERDEFARQVVQMAIDNAALQMELSTLRESMRAGSLLRKVGEPLPKGCYCTLGKCTAPRPEWCRDSEKRDYKPPEDSSDGR